MANYEGETLKERIELGPLALDEAVDISARHPWPMFVMGVTYADWGSAPRPVRCTTS